MALYFNHSRRDAIVTIKIAAVQNPKNGLKIGIESSMDILAADIGVHDVVVGPGQALEAMDGVDATFLAARSDR